MSSMSKTGIIFDIKEFTVHDGPGVRTTVFLKGCPLSCVWCHNPEGQRFQPEVMTVGECKGCGACTKGCNHPECEGLDRCAFACPYGVLRIAGERVEAKALAEKLKRQLIFLEEGGITLSGGEPLSQPAFALELLRELKPLHTVIETCGYADSGAFLEAAKLCDIVYMDIKVANPIRHKELTGVDNAPILRNLKTLSTLGKPYVIRIPLIPTLTDTEENIRGIAALLKDLPNLERVELMPCNPYTAAKYSWVGMECSVRDIAAPLKPDTALAQKILEESGISSKIL